MSARVVLGRGLVALALAAAAYVVLSTVGARTSVAIDPAERVVVTNGVKESVPVDVQGGTVRMLNGPGEPGRVIQAPSATAQWLVSMSVLANSSAAEKVVLTAPAGKRFIPTMVSAHVSAPDGQNIEFQLKTSGDVNPGIAYIPLERIPWASSSNDYWQATIPGGLTVKDGAQIRARIARDAIVGAVTGTITVQGYYIDL